MDATVPGFHFENTHRTTFWLGFTLPPDPSVFLMWTKCAIKAKLESQIAVGALISVIVSIDVAHSTTSLYSTSFLARIICST